jgi:hypothetical protein
MLLFTSYLMLRALASSIDIIRLSKHSKNGGSIEYKHDIIIHSWDLNNVLYFNSNKSPTRCNNFPVYYPDVYLQLNMFQASSRPSSGTQWLQWQPLVLPSYRGDSRAVFVAGLTTNTAWLSPRYESKTRGCYCSHWAPDDERENAWNMLSCK